MQFFQNDQNKYNRPGHIYVGGFMLILEFFGLKVHDDDDDDDEKINYV